MDTLLLRRRLVTIDSVSFVQTFAFLISGVGIIGLAYAIRRLTVGAWGSLTGALLIGVYGVGALLVAIFPTDRIDTPADVLTQSTTGMIHSLLLSNLGPMLLMGVFVCLGYWLWAEDMPAKQAVPGMHKQREVGI